MTKKFRIFKGLFIAFALLMAFSSCEKLYPSYEIRVENDMQATVLGIPSNKYDLVELTIGDVTFGELAYGETSGYQEIETGEFDVKVKVKAYMINDYGGWDYTGEETYDLGSETFASNESYDKFTIYLDTYLLIPSMEVYGDE